MPSVIQRQQAPRFERMEIDYTNDASYSGVSKRIPFSRWYGRGNSVNAGADPVNAIAPDFTEIWESACVAKPNRPATDKSAQPKCQSEKLPKFPGGKQMSLCPKRPTRLGRRTG